MNKKTLTIIKAKTRNNFSLMIFELFYKAAFYVTVVLLFQHSVRITLRFSRFSYITFENLNAYLRSPITIILILSMLFVAGIFLLVEIIALTTFFYSDAKNRRINIQQIMFPGIFRVRTLFRKKANIIIMPFFAVIEGLFLMFPLIASALTRFRMPKSIFAGIGNNKNLPLVLSLIFILIIITGCLGIFTLQYCSFENKDFFEAFIMSIQLIKKHVLSIIMKYLINTIMLVACFFASYYLLMVLAGFIVYSFADEKVMMTAYISISFKLNVMLAVFYAMIGMLINLSSITKMFIIFRKNEGEKTSHEIERMQERIINEEIEVPVFNLENKKRTVYIGRYKLINSIIFIFIAIFSIIYIFNWIRNGTFTSQQVLLGINITAHRGASKDAPENTIASIEQAITDYADYAEIDVQQTKDGVVILLHDDNVKRTTNGTGYIWDYTYYDLMQLDAGSWFSADYKGVRIPTLAEVLEAAKGRIYLNIEIKKNSHNVDIVEKVVKLIEENAFEQQCVISSTHYASLAKVKELNPNIKTGYIMALAYGNFYENEHADFFSIKSGFINENLVRIAHSLGKEVHAWTVNSKTELERMKNIGVDNIITDNPILAKEIVHSDEHESLNSFLSLFINR